MDHDEDYVRAFDARDLGPGSEATLFGHQYQQRLEAIRRAVRARATEGGRLVDLGCAQGNIALRLASDGFEVTGVDMNAAFLRVAQEKDRERRVTWLLGSIADFAPDPKFDVVVAGEVIEHTGTPEQFVAVIWRSLVPGGVLILTTPNGSRLRAGMPSYREWASRTTDRPDWIQFGPAGEHHAFLFTRAELKQLLQFGFEDVRIRGLSSVVVNRHSEWALKSEPARSLLLTSEKLSLLRPLQRSTANAWLVSAIRSASEPGVAGDAGAEPSVGVR